MLRSKGEMVECDNGESYRASLKEKAKDVVKDT